MNVFTRRFMAILAVSLLILSPAEAARKAGKAKVADRKTEVSPAWVWPRPQTPAGTEFRTFRSAVLGGQEVGYLL